jgi:hypothetical protein
MNENLTKLYATPGIDKHWTMGKELLFRDWSMIQLRSSEIASELVELLESAEGGFGEQWRLERLEA